MNTKFLNSTHNDHIYPLKKAPQWDIAESQRIVREKLGGIKADIYLFGSRADGTMGRYSDIDIGIDPYEPLPVGLLAEIREALEESQIIYQVDLVDLSQTSQTFRRRVLEKGIQWKD
ncbi:nucleotidyltransferase family protein [Nitrosococcus watsonii]|uniref:DNA polymerase beta domain protein region n=1 Tax=Nitrosococcus watsoni (strain C-113) TaxID=105559 RepID=D8K9V8_NITWC|nr:nucleotidyltransferase domain-containing protein [Nitrosococcus watsonii]ADJ29316.1 DNA polymerase beta domain protein region [Nitrosococcus watsonii C-113]